MAEPHEETAFPKPKNCRRCGNPLGVGAVRCEVCNQEVAEPRSLLVVGLIVTFVVLVGVLVAIWAVNST